jgi:hypothetical protein
MYGSDFASTGTDTELLLQNFATTGTGTALLSLKVVLLLHY